MMDMPGRQGWRRPGLIPAGTGGGRVLAEEYFRAQQITLTYDAAAGALRADAGKAATAVTLKAS